MKARIPKLDPFAWLLIAGVIIYILYLGYITSPAPNKYLVNETDPATNLTHIVTKVRYPENAIVPGQIVSQDQLILLGILNGVMIVYLIFRTESKTMLSNIEMRKIIHNELLYKRDTLNDVRFKNCSIIPGGFHLRSIGKGMAGEMMPYKAVFNFEIRNMDTKLPENWYFTINPFTGYISDELPFQSDKLWAEDICPRCGNSLFVDYKIIPSEELREYKRLEKKTSTTGGQQQQ